MTADEIHALGLSEVARITAEMDRLLQAAGDTEGTVGQRMQQSFDGHERLLPAPQPARGWRRELRFRAVEHAADVAAVRIDDECGRGAAEHEQPALLG